MLALGLKAARGFPWFHRVLLELKMKNLLFTTAATIVILHICQCQVEEVFGVSMGGAFTEYRDQFPPSVQYPRQRPNSKRLDFGYRELIFPERFTPYRTYTGYFKPPPLYAIPLKYNRPNPHRRRHYYPGNVYRPPVLQRGDSGSRQASHPAPQVRADSYAQASVVAPGRLDSAAVISRSYVEGSKTGSQSASYKSRFSGFEQQR